MIYMTADMADLADELERFADDLSRLPKSVETTGLELRFAMLRAMIEAKFELRSSNDNDEDGPSLQEENHGQ
jgi:hypothetical protein